MSFSPDWLKGFFPLWKIFHWIKLSLCRLRKIATLYSRSWDTQERFQNIFKLNYVSKPNLVSLHSYNTKQNELSPHSLYFNNNIQVISRHFQNTIWLLLLILVANQKFSPCEFPLACSPWIVRWKLFRIIFCLFHIHF